jgi:hypothetical protein
VCDGSGGGGGGGGGVFQVCFRCVDTVIANQAMQRAISSKWWWCVGGGGGGDMGGRILGGRILVGRRGGVTTLVLRSSGGYRP